MGDVRNWMNITRASVLLATCGWLGGCASAPEAASDSMSAINAEHVRRFADFELPRKLGAVENVGLQMPMVSPEGQRLLYLRTDAEWLSPMTPLGAAPPEDASLEIWLRPLAGTAPGRKLSRGGWSHSATWSTSGAIVAYVAAEEQGTRIVCVNVESGQEWTLGVPGAVNCMPRFEQGDAHVLFCAGHNPEGPFRVFRQALHDDAPVVLTPEGLDCVLPIMTESTGHAICARTDGNHLSWVAAGLDGTRVLEGAWGVASRPDFLLTWGGVTAPLSPGGRDFLYFDSSADRMAVWHGKEQRVRRHRPGSIAACWMSADAIALATADDLFAVNTRTGMSLTLFNGAWLPCRFIERERRLILFGMASPHRLSIHQIVFRLREPQQVEPSRDAQGGRR